MENFEEIFQNWDGGGVRNSKKGMTTAISVVLLASALLALTSAVAFYANSNSFSAAELSGFEGVNLQFDSAAYGIRELARANAVYVTVNGNSTANVTNITFSGNASNLNRYSDDLTNFKNFTEAFAQEAPVSMNISQARLSPMNLYVSPQGIKVSHTVGRTNFAPNPPQASSVRGYGVQLIFSSAGPDHVAWDSQHNDTGPDNLSLNIAWQGSSGAGLESAYLDRSENSTMRLLDSANYTFVSIQVLPNSELSVNYDLDTDLYIAVIMQLNGTVEAVELGADMVDVGDCVPGSSEPIGICKSGKVLVYAG